MNRSVVSTYGVHFMGRKWFFNRYLARYIQKNVMTRDDTRHSVAQAISGFSSFTALTKSSIPPTSVGPSTPSGGKAHAGRGLT